MLIPGEEETALKVRDNSGDQAWALTLLLPADLQLLWTVENPARQDVPRRSGIGETLTMALPSL